MKTRVTYYAYGVKYLGWEYLTFNTINRLTGWVRSGNTLKINGEVVSTIERLRELYYNH